ncbi:hypothetical protein D3C80_2118190 [compost metagenome]
MFSPDEQQVALQLAAGIKAIHQDGIVTRLLQQQHMASCISLGYLNREQAGAKGGMPRQALRYIE